MGPATVEVIKRILSSRSIVEQTYIPATSVMSLTRSYDKERIENASREALTKVSSPRYKHLKAILSATEVKGNTVKTTKAEKAQGCLLGKEFFNNEEIKK